MAARPVRVCSCVGRVGFYSEFPTDPLMEETLVVGNETTSSNVFEVERLIVKRTIKVSEIRLKRLSGYS